MAHPRWYFNWSHLEEHNLSHLGWQTAIWYNKKWSGGLFRKHWGDGGFLLMKSVCLPLRELALSCDVWVHPPPSSTYNILITPPYVCSMALLKLLIISIWQNLGYFLSHLKTCHMWSLCSTNQQMVYVLDAYVLSHTQSSMEF